MSWTSPFANTTEYVNKVNSLSTEGITIDKGVGQATRDAVEFASRYSANFQIVVDLKTSTEEFNNRWTPALLRTRDVASLISGYYQRFDQVFLGLIDDIASDQDSRDVVSEFHSFLREELPSHRYDLNSTAGVKTAFETIENLVAIESNHVIQVLQSENWQRAVEKLQEGLPIVRRGVQDIRQALNNYATRLN